MFSREDFGDEGFGDVSYNNAAKVKESSKDYCCPITTEIMVDPVTAADGHSYERSAITQWLAKNNTSPLTGEELEHKQVIPNRTFKKAIQSFVEENKPFYQKQFIEAMKNRNFDTIEHLEKLGINIKHQDQNGWTLLHHAAYEGDMDKINLWLAKGFDINQNTANLYAGIYPSDLPERIEQTKAKISLLEQKKQHYDPDLYKKYEQYKAIIKGKSQNEIQSARESAKKEYDEASSVYDREYRSGRNDGKPSDNLWWVQRFLTAQERFNRIDQLLAFSGQKAFKEFEEDELQLVQLKQELQNLEYKSTSKIYFTKLSAIHLAIYQNNISVVRFLLEKGANREVQDGTGATPIFWSIYRNNLPILKLLIENNINLDARDDQGNTILHAAARYSDQSIVTYLLDDIGIYYQMKNKDNQTPSDYALSFEREQIAHSIEQRGEQISQNVPRKLIAQDKRIVSLEQQVKFLQEQLDSLLKNNINVGTSIDKPLEGAFSLVFAEKSSQKSTVESPDVKGLETKVEMSDTSAVPNNALSFFRSPANTGSEKQQSHGVG